MGAVGWMDWSAKTAVGVVLGIEWRKEGEVLKWLPPFTAFCFCFSLPSRFWDSKPEGCRDEAGT
jgi:hypothetical protein